MAQNIPTSAITLDLRGHAYTFPVEDIYGCYKLGGTGNLLGGITISSGGTPVNGTTYTIYWNANVNLNGFSISIFGNTLTQEQAGRKSLMIFQYNGATWDFNVFIDQSDLPSMVSGMDTITLNAAGGVVTLDPALDTKLQVIAGSAIMVGNWSITGGGTPVAGDEFIFLYTATMTVGANTITIFGDVLSEQTALSGNALIHTVYNGAAWVTAVTTTDTLWKSGTGTNSIRQSFSGQATATGSLSLNSDSVANGNYSIAGGQATVATGANSYAGGSSCTATGQYSFVHGDTCVTDIGSVAFGVDNTCSRVAAAVGQQNYSNYYSLSSGYGSAARLYGTRAFACGMPIVGKKGSSQSMDMILGAYTTDAAPTEALTTASARRYTIPVDCSIGFEIEVVATQTGGGAGTVGDSFHQIIRLSGTNLGGVSAIIPTTKGNVVNMQNVAANVVYELSDVSGAFGGTVTAAISNALSALVVTVTGEVNKNIYWTVYVRGVETGFRNFDLGV